MNANTLSAIDKLLEAKKLEKEALSSLLPGDISKHIDVIGREVRAIVIETFLAMNEKDSTTDKDTEESQAKPHVKKVDIG